MGPGHLCLITGCPTGLKGRHPSLIKEEVPAEVVVELQETGRRVWAKEPEG